ncbi:hypothetical protein Dda_0244 [Drechslerella dactyloides]|uniref:EGF-like domain-containing protein n=1 Tax=Drechslerella dactyloides TaxID=74499 RepID=A0AAD6J7M7_DREDA|nr:hypothetical protein Dda_0244 [Drechslerella dactyloides]
MLNFSRRSYNGYDQSRNTLDRLDEDPIYEDQPTTNLRVVNGGLEPRHMRKGSYVEDDGGYAAPLGSPEGYSAVAAAFPVYGSKSGAAASDVSNRKRDAREQNSSSSSSSIPRPSGRSGRSGNARRSLIQGPQPQPHSQSSSSRSSKNHLPPNPASTVEAYRQQQQQLQQHYLSALTARQQGGRHSNQGIASSPSGFGRYSPPLEADEDAEDENMRASSRSIMIGFDSAGASSPAPVSGGVPSPSSTPQTGSSSPPVQTGGLAPFPGASGRRASASSTASSTGKRGYPSSSHYSQVSYVSTIPEEGSDFGRHGSYASSHVIPSSWGSPAGGLWIPGSHEELMSDGASSISKGSNSSKSRSDDYAEFDEGTTLVRQASLGRKQKPKLTEVVRTDSKSRGSRSEGGSHSSHSQARKGSVASSHKTDSKGSMRLTEKGTVLTVVNAGEISEEAQPPVPRVGFWQRLSQLSVKTGATDVAPKPLKFGSGKNSPEEAQEKGWTPPSASAPFGIGNINLAVPQATLNRPRPPRLNIDAVREAEARGSLTSLPELIRRATKLAAVLETGSRPDSRWGGSRAPSIMSTDTHHHGRYQESLSDILASFPPPLASSRRLSSRGTTWPLPGEFAYLQSGDPSEIRRRRKICGLPLWAFIVLVLLAIIVATAAVILPVQLVSMSKDKNKSSLTPDSCARSNPCLNGGIAAVESGKCSCICTNEFFGLTCAQSNDPACTTFTLTDTTNNQFLPRNVSLGLAVPRILTVSQPTFNVPIDTLALSNNFALQNTTCALQNALVTLNGRTAPLNKTDTVGLNGGPGSGFALDESVVDFGRVAVLYLASTSGMRQAVMARESLGAMFAAGKDYGSVKVDEGVTVDLTNLRISTGGGTTVVGGPSGRVRMAMHRRSAADDMRAHLIRRHKIHSTF